MSKLFLLKKSCHEYRFLYNKINILNFKKDDASRWDYKLVKILRKMVWLPTQCNSTTPPGGMFFGANIHQTQ